MTDLKTLIFLIIPLSIFPFWPSLQGSFVFDDNEAILRNADVISSGVSWSQIFMNDFWGKLLTSNSSHKSYRPLTILSFRWNYMHTLDPKPFHIFNFILHASSCVLLWFVYGVILKEKDIKKPLKVFLSTRSLAVILFAVHPVHTENVAGIVGRADILAAICFFAAFLLYTKVINNVYRNWIFWMGSILFFVLCFMSMLFKENGITVLGFCLTYELTEMFNGALFCSPKLRIWIKIFCTVIIGISALSFRWWIMGGSMPYFQSVDNPASFMDSFILRVLNYFYIYAIDAWILLCPIWLCFDWSMGCIPLIQDFTDLRILAILFFCCIFAAFFVTVLCCKNIDWTYKRKMVNALMLMILPFLPASNLLVKVGFVVGERVLYLTSAGFCLIVAIGIDNLRQKIRLAMIWDIIGITLVVIYFTKCWLRSGDWCTEEKLFNSGVAVCPLNAKIHYNIAKNAADNGKLDVALLKYREALQLYPRYEHAMNNLANLLKDNGNIVEAEELLLKCVEIRSDFSTAWMNLGIVQAFLKKYEKAELSYLTAISYRNNYPDCYYNLGNLYLDMKLYDLAYSAWRNATLLKSNHVGSWNNMVIMFDNIGDLERAKQLGEESIKALPNAGFVYFNLANVLGKLGDFSNSEANFLKAINIKETNAAYYTNLGVLYHRSKKYSEAIKAYKNALRLNSKAKSASDNLKKILSITNFE